MNDEPAPGSFEDYLWNYEVDVLGSEGLADAATRARIYAEWLEGQKGDAPANRAAGAAQAVKTKSRNAEAGISQKGLSGTPKQKQWAAQIRHTYASMPGIEREVLYAEFPKAKWWIENRSDLSAAIAKSRR